jgi:hypothetical protein
MLKTEIVTVQFEAGDAQCHEIRQVLWTVATGRTALWCGIQNPTRRKS